MNNERITYAKSKLSGFVLALLFLSGLLLVLYPSISNELAKYNMIQTIETHKTYTANLNNEQLTTIWAKAKEYNEHLAGDPVRDPYVKNSGMALPENYIEVLNPQNDGIMGYLEIPKVNIALSISHGTSDEVLEKGAGHIEQTSLPVGGANTHAVITAHTGLPTAYLFNNLTKVEKKDRFYIYILDKLLTYQVDKIEVIEPSEVEKLRIVPEADYVTLMTCTPYGVNSHRLLVRGTRIPNEKIAEQEEKHFNWIPILLIVLIVIIIMLIIFVIRWYRKRKRGSDGI